MTILSYIDPATASLFSKIMLTGRRQNVTIHEIDNSAVQACFINN